jgi:hypothetical protein
MKTLPQECPLWYSFVLPSRIAGDVLPWFYCEFEEFRPTFICSLKTGNKVSSNSKWFLVQVHIADNIEEQDRIDSAQTFTRRSPRKSCRCSSTATSTASRANGSSACATPVATLVSQFTTDRMVKEYTTKYYAPAQITGLNLEASDGAKNFLRAVFRFDLKIISGGGV